ncbi:MAG: hypothetical protein UIM53_01045 [Acutalibacteraceae bacterium]|nr:hypothetical protein [Acutalibacteraceae bacterium]
MIQSQDRSYYIGASDTSIVVGNWTTKTFQNWWLEKLGLRQNKFTNEAMKAGNNYEHKILDSLNVPGLEKDKQIIKDRLRVNLDGNTRSCIYEVKTYNASKEFKVSKAYWRQAQVEMYASGIRTLYIVAYGLVDNDYKNYFNKIDKRRISMHKVDYDRDFIEKEYLPKLRQLTICLKSGRFPGR